MSSAPVSVALLAAAVGILCSIGILTNAVMILFYVRRPGMRTSTNVYFVHKTVADIISLLPFPFHLLEALNLEVGWTLGGWPCKMVASIETLCMVVSANLILGAAYDRLTAITKPGSGLERTVVKSRNHAAAAWVYSLLLVLPVTAVAWTVNWPPGNSPLSPRRATCGYRWPTGEEYHTMYFISLFVILYVTHYLVYFCFTYMVWKRVRGSKEDFLARHDTVQRCRAVATMVIINFIAYFVYWSHHVYMMAWKGHDRTNVPHIPTGLTDPLSAAASVAVYIAAGSNLFVCSRFMDQWRSVVLDAMHCRCGKAAGAVVQPYNAEDGAVAVIDVTAAVDEPRRPSSAERANSIANSENSGPMKNLPNVHQSNEELDVQEIAV